MLFMCINRLNSFPVVNGQKKMEIKHRLNETQKSCLYNIILNLLYVH